MIDKSNEDVPDRVQLEDPGTAAVGGGGNGNLFPHPRTGERRRCKRCTDILWEGYTEARKKMCLLTLQCQKCISILWCVRPVLNH